MDNGDLGQAIEKLKESAELFPHFKTYECIGDCYLQLGQAQEAVPFLAAAAGLGNKQVRPYLLLAKALIATGDLDLARTKLNEVLAINPNYRAAGELLESLPADLADQ